LIFFYLEISAKKEESRENDCAVKKREDSSEQGIDTTREREAIKRAPLLSDSSTTIYFDCAVSLTQLVVWIYPRIPITCQLTRGALIYASVNFHQRT